MLDAQSRFLVDDLTRRQTAILAGDLAALVTWLRGMVTPEQWTAVSQAMSLLTGQSLDQRLSIVCSAVTFLPTPALTVLLALFRDVGADLVAGRGHRPLTGDETEALELLRDVLAMV